MKQKQRFYKDLAIYYDLVFKDKNYSKEADFVRSIARQHKLGNELLDIGCGTGVHDELLKKDFNITGIDPNKQILDIAIKRNKKVSYYPMAMADFKLSQKFDVIISLFGVVQYAKDYIELRKTFNNIHKHLKPKGLFIFDVGLTTDTFKDHTEVSGVSRNKLGVTMIMNDYKIDPNHINTSLVFFIRDSSGFRTEYDEHIQLLIDVNKTKRMLESVGFKVKLYDNDFSGKLFTKQSKRPVFVCTKKMI